MKPSRARLGRLVTQGLSDAQIGAELGLCARTVFRWRKAYKIASQWTPPPVTHGTTAYVDGRCHCQRCTAAHLAAQRHQRQNQQARSAQQARRHGDPWTSDEDAYLLAHGATAASKKLGRTFYACRARLTKLRSAATT